MLSTAVAQEKKITIVVTDFAVSSDDESLANLQKGLSQLLAARLSASEKVRVVDREQIDKVLNELKLSLKGITDSENAKKVGKILGADFFVNGNLMKFKDEIAIAIKVTNVETTEITAGTLKVKSAEDVFDVVDKAGEEVIALLGKASARKEGDDSEKPLESIPKDAKRPSVMVVIPETHLTRIVPDPAGETEVIRRLLVNEFKVKDRAFVQKIREDKAKMERLEKDAVGAAKIGAEYEVDVVIIGEAFSERAGQSGDLVTCRARVEAKAVDTKTGEIIATHGESAGATDVGEMVAGKAALVTAARRLADYFALKLVRKYNNIAEEPQTFILIARIDERVEKEQFVKEVAALTDVKDARIVRSEKGKVELSVKFSGTSWEIADRLVKGIKGHTFSNMNIEGNTISFEVK
jgi:TolB-like protein